MKTAQFAAAIGSLHAVAGQKFPRSAHGIASRALVVAALLLAAAPLRAQDRVIAWNDLGMHCMDPGYRVFCLLPPFNDFTAQVIVGGHLVTDGSTCTVTYEGLADATGSINLTSVGKTDFWQHVPALFGVSLAPDVGLAGNAMPGLANVPQPIPFDAALRWFKANGIPITPTDDQFKNNTYPMMKAVARNAGGSVLASAPNVTPVSDEMDCSRCHVSGGSPWAKPVAGWVFDPNRVDDYRWNILRLHDERQAGDPTYAAALTTAGYSPLGLYATARAGTSILCAKCHLSNALPGSGIPSVKPLTEAIHAFHGGVKDTNGLALDSVQNRSACYTCHPGSVTRCLRGAMGSAVAADGSLAMQCQSCHGGMSKVGTTGRVGWLAQPSCQQCHTGTATQNSGQIRFTSVFDQNGVPHVPANSTFATDANTPAPGFDLYRFSDGHGGLQCEACHGSTHAEYPAAHPNDNVMSVQAQGHVGMLVECVACHGTTPATVSGGPHGMHPIGATWVSNHGTAAEGAGVAQCRKCHGADDRGTVLSRSQANRTINTGDFGTKNFWRGFQISCFACHNGPTSELPTTNHAPAVTNKAVATQNDQSVAIDLTGSDSDANPLTYRVVSQPEHGTVGISGAIATWFPEAGFVGVTSFTFAAWDGKTDSNLGTVTVTSNAASCPGQITQYGFGCPGSGDFLPQLAMTGCATQNGSVTLSVTQGNGGANGLLFFGATRGVAMLQHGCVLRVTPVSPVILPFALGAGGAGAGQFSINGTIPSGTPSVTVTMQAFLVDPGVFQGFAATNGIEVAIH